MPKKKSGSKTAKAKAKPKPKPKANVKLDPTYCGIGKIPTGKSLATAEYCLNRNQVRYYGVKEISPKLLAKPKGKSLEKERVKFLKLRFDARNLVKEYQIVRIILDDPRSTKSELKSANKKRANIVKRKDALKKKLDKQKKIITQLEEAKYGKKNKPKSGSKTPKSKSKPKPKSKSKGKTKSKSRKK